MIQRQSLVILPHFCHVLGILPQRLAALHQFLIVSGIDVEDQHLELQGRIAGGMFKGVGQPHDRPLRHRCGSVVEDGKLRRRELYELCPVQVGVLR